MDKPFLRSYRDLLIKTCHRRGACATDGMAGQLLPVENGGHGYQKTLAQVKRSHITSDRRQSKTLFLSTNVDQTPIEIEFFSIANCQLATVAIEKAVSKFLIHVHRLLRAFFECRLSSVCIIEEYLHNLPENIISGALVRCETR